MRLLLNLGGKRKPTLSGILSRFLSRTREGKNIIRAFRKDRKAASPAVLDYYEQHLKDQPEFQRQLEEMLSQEEGGHFSTVVGPGGNVDQIINAGVVEQLEIRYVLFEDTPQVISFFGMLFLTGAVLASGYWWTIQPRRMTGDFNIAVAEFSQQGDSEPKMSDMVSQQVFRFLDDQAKLITFENVQVSHKNIGMIGSAQEARALAQRINAQVVIYGDVMALGKDIRLTPQFYIAEAFRADAGELNGQQRLTAPISFPMKDLIKPDPKSMKLLQGRMTIMTEFTKALVFLEAGKLPLAREAIEQAIILGKQQNPFKGEEILYLFGAHISRVQGDQEMAQKYIDEALKINSNYGRAYIAQAHLYYDEGNLYQAIQNFEKAKQLPDQPFGAYITEKADYGIGNSCLVQLEYVNQNPEPDSSATAQLEDCVLQNYQQVIDSYQLLENPGTNLTELTAWAYFGSGTVLQDRGQLQEAQNCYRQALALTNDSDLASMVSTRLQEAKK